MEYSQERSTRPTHPLLVDRITALRTRVQELRAQTEKLEAQRDRLRDENRSLRRRLTRTQLADDVLRQAEAVVGPEEDEEQASEAHRLYEALPDTGSFTSFFRVAEREGLDTAAARRCLRHFLGRELLVQEGGQLAKQAPAA